MAELNQQWKVWSFWASDGWMKCDPEPLASDALNSSRRPGGGRVYWQGGVWVGPAPRADQSPPCTYCVPTCTYCQTHPYLHIFSDTNITVKHEKHTYLRSPDETPHMYLLRTYAYLLTPTTGPTRALPKTKFCCGPRHGVPRESPGGPA